MSSPEDGELIERVLRGEESCFEVLVKRYSCALYNLAFRITFDREAARDLTQEAFLAAHKNLSGYRGQGSFSSWLYRILTNKCITFINRRKKIIFTALDEGEPGRSDNAAGGDPALECERKEVMERLQREINNLSPDHRVAFTLFYLIGRSYREVGEILGIPESKVKSDLFRARRSLRKSLEDLWT